MSDEFFVVGQQYENRKGVYTVVEIADAGMRVQYQDGSYQLIKDLLLQEQIVVRLQLEKAPPALMKKRRPSKSESPDNYWHWKDVFPIITRIIHEQYVISQDFVPHKQIWQVLLNDPEGQKEITIANVRRRTAGVPEQPPDKMADNMVRWFSQSFPEGWNEWRNDFERRWNGTWAYRPRQVNLE